MSGQRDRPWVMRTYAGHSSAKASNELYRLNLAKGQTGLSVAFDLPTQTGYPEVRPVPYLLARDGTRGRAAGRSQELLVTLPGYTDFRSVSAGR